MSMILNTKQVQQYLADMDELARYRALGMTPERIQELLFPPDADAPLPLDLGNDDIPVAAGLLADDDWDPAAEAQGRYGQDQWHK